MKRRGQTIFSPEERIKRKVSISSNGCWNWNGATRNGYGRLSVGSRVDGIRRTVAAHRYAYETYTGEIPAGYEVCHKCDNPSCVNPEHLFVGTRQDNVDDRESKGRNNHTFGEASATAKLTDAKAIEALKLRQCGLSYKKIGDIVGVSKRSIISLCQRKTWTHLELPTPPEAPHE